MRFRTVTDADVPQLFAVRVRTGENVLSLEQLARMGITEESALALKVQRV